MFMNENLLVLNFGLTRSVEHNLKMCFFLSKSIYFTLFFCFCFWFFFWQMTTNRVQLNIPNDSKTFMCKTIHTLCVYNLFQRPWDFWPKFRSIYWMKWETRFSTLNLIIRLIFPVGKKGPIRKENFVLCTISLRFSVFYNNFNKHLI